MVGNSTKVSIGDHLVTFHKIKYVNQNSICGGLDPFTMFTPEN